jgi:hypothetical protein
VYVARNPKDAAVSWFHHHRHLHVYKGTKEDFMKAFLKDEMLYSPFNEHILEFWKIRNDPNILFLFYEDMKKDLKKEVRRAINFVGKEYSDDQVEKLVQHLSFETMQKNKRINKEDEIKMLKESAGETYNPEEFSFIRKGIVGGWKKDLSDAENEQFDSYMNHPEFKKFGFAYRI